jgi:hypothetical protein
MILQAILIAAYIFQILDIGNSKDQTNCVPFFLTSITRIPSRNTKPVRTVTALKIIALDHSSVGNTGTMRPLASVLVSECKSPSSFPSIGVPKRTPNPARKYAIPKRILLFMELSQ